MGRSSDRYVANNPPSHSNSVQIRHAMVADNIGNAFEPRYTPEQQPIGISQYSANPMYPLTVVPETFANPMYRPTQIRNDERSGTSLSQGTVHKIQELKLLMNRYSYYHTNPDEIIKLAIFNSINGDDALLDSKLEQIRSMDRRLKGRARAFTVF